MALPTAMPIFGIASVEKFELENVDSVNDLISGAAHATEIAPPYWEMTVSTTNMTVWSDRYQSWRAFLDERLGQKVPALFHDPKKPYPITYRKTRFAGMVKAGTATPFVGLGEVDSFTDRRHIVISSLPAGFILKKTDLVQFQKGDYASLHRLTADVTANGSGIATITVEPRVPTVFDAASQVQFAYPGFVGLITGKIRDSHDIESGTISFSARSTAEWGSTV